jgi:hypothetical protein
MELFMKVLIASLTLEVFAFDEFYLLENNSEKFLVDDF